MQVENNGAGASGGESGAATETSAPASGGSSAAAPGTATPSPAGSAGAKVGGSAGAPGSTPAGAGGATTPPAYAPNFKYKYLSLKDGKEEQVEAELDDLFKPLVKDAETEKKIRELHERAYGIDYVKGERGRLKEEHTALVQKYEGINQSLAMAGQFVQLGDFDSFFEMLKIPSNKVLEWAIAHAQRSKDPNAQAAYNQQRQTQLQMLQLQQQNQSLQTVASSAAVTQRTMELDQVLTRPELGEKVAAFDRVMGRAGAFKSEVIRRGQYHAAVNQQDATAEQVVAEVLQMYGNLLTAPASQPVITPTGQPAAAAPTREAKPVIPNVPGKGTSPVKKGPKSVDDLRKMAADRRAAANVST